MRSGVHQLAAWALMQFGRSPRGSFVGLSKRSDSVAASLADWKSLIVAQEKAKEVATKAIPQRREQWRIELGERLEEAPDLLDDPALAFRFLVESPSKVSLRTDLSDESEVQRQIAQLKKVGGVQGYSLELEGNTSIEFGDAVRVERDEPFSHGGWVYSRDKVGWGGVVSKFSTKDDFRGFDLWLNGTPFSSHIVFVDLAK